MKESQGNGVRTEISRRRTNTLAAICIIKYATLYGFKFIIWRRLCELVPVDAKKAYTGRRGVAKYLRSFLTSPLEVCV